MSNVSTRSGSAASDANSRSGSAASDVSLRSGVSDELYERDGGGGGI